MVHFVYTLMLVVFAASVACEVMNERYIVMLEKGASDFDIEQIIQKVEQYTISSRDELFIYFDNVLLPFFYGNFSQETVRMISTLDKVVMIEKDQVVTIDDTFNEPDQNITHQVGLDALCEPPTDRYNLDIIDNIGCTDGVFSPPNNGEDVDIYIIDTGINIDHVDFKKCDGSAGSRASLLYDYEGDTTTQDCNGHGTYCAGIAAGVYSGVAKKANLFSIRVLDCWASGSDSNIMKGMSAGKRNHDIRMKSGDSFGSVFSMSIGGSKSPLLDKFVREIVQQGINVVTASGNQAKDACNVSPGGAGPNINVGSHAYFGYGISECFKPMTYLSNYGPCVTIMAPGYDILSASHWSNTEFSYNSGTSAACPHVSGVVAIFLNKWPSATPDQIKGAVVAYGIKDITASKWIDSNGLSRTSRLHISS